MPSPRRRVLLAVPLLLAVPCLHAAEPPGSGSPTREAVEPAIPVRVDPRVELMSLIFRLAGSPEYNQARVPSYAADADTQFGPHRDHPVVVTARRLRRERGVSYDAVMSMAIHVTDAGTLGELLPLDPLPAALDRRWTTGEASLFLEQARDFARVADFAGFIDGHRGLYDVTERRLQAVIDQEHVLEWFNAFFGSRPSAEFTICPGMLNGGGCYGPRVERGPGDEQLYCILGVWSTDDQGLPRFDAGMLGTVVHEFCHSYVNPLVYANESALEPAGRTIYPFVESTMREQAYGNWTTMMLESLVRASVVRYERARGGPDAEEREIRDQVDRGFHWMPELAGLLAEYESQRDRYPDLATFFPRVIAFFDQYAPAFAERMARQAAAAPRIVRMIPANGAEDVDPSLAEMVITFDRPMRDQSWSVVGGGPHFPELVGRPSFDETRTVLTVAIRLKPGWSYELWLNRGRYSSFRSADGVPLEPVHVTFSTR